MSETMTIKEISETAGCNEKTVRRIGKQLFPALFKKGVKVEFGNAQAIQLMKSLPKKNIVGQMSEEHRTNDLGTRRTPISEVGLATVQTEMSQDIKDIKSAILILTQTIQTMAKNQIEAKAQKSSLQKLSIRISKSEFIELAKEKIEKYNQLKRYGYRARLEIEYLEEKNLRPNHYAKQVENIKIIYAIGQENDFLNWCDAKIRGLGNR